MKLDDFLRTKYGYNPDVKNNMQTYIDQWNSWYVGNVKDFHNYLSYFLYCSDILTKVL